MLKTYILIVFSFFLHTLVAQGVKNEKELIKMADELFEEKSFVDALPLYSQLLSLNPQDANYNFRFGTCVIFSGLDRATAIKHLSFSTERGVNDPRAYYYSGLAYHLNYEFRKAKTQYSEFLKRADDNIKEDFSTQRQIEMCVNGESLLSNITDLIVIDKKEVSESDFFRYYNLEEIGGKIIAKPEEFLTKNDKKRGLKGVVHFDRASDYIFYSSYGKDDDNLDIYRVKPLPSGGFSKPEKVKGDVNTPYDDDFGFLHADGETLYFCSKGHTSMGGYDVFSATYDVFTDEYNKVKNLDFAVNTPDDDMLYLVDSTKTMAYFSSGRSSSLNNLNVYQVRVESIPIRLIVLQGDFVAEFDDKLKNSKITVSDEFTGKPVGEFYTNQNNGSYVIPIEKSGTYKFSIEAENSPNIHEGIVEIPRFNEPVALHQKLILKKENGKESLQIINYFDEILEVDMAELTQEVMRRKAGLDVNSGELELLLADETEGEQELVSLDRSIEEAPKVAGFEEGTTNQDVANSMVAKSDEFKEEAEKLSAKAQEAYAEAQIKLNSSSVKFAQGKSDIEKAESASGEDKIALIDSGNRFLAEAKQESLEAQSLLEVVKSVDEYKEHLVSQSSDLIENAAIVSSSQDYSEVVEILKSEKTRRREIDKTDDLNPINSVNEAENFSRNELDNLVSRIDNLRKEEKELGLKVAGQKRTLDATSKKKDREALEEEIRQTEAEYSSVLDEIDSESRKVNVIGLDAENYALQRHYLDKINNENSEFEGQATAYDLSQLADQIDQAKNTSAEASDLIPEDYEAVASASEELKERIELKEINSKLSALSSSVELKQIDQIRSDFELKTANLTALENETAQLARARALNTQLSESLEDEITKVDQVLESEELAYDEKESLQAHRNQLVEEKSNLDQQEFSATEVSEERIEQIKEIYVAAEDKKLEDWKENSASFSGLTDAEFMAMKAAESIQKKIDSKNKTISESNDEEEILALENELHELEAVKEDYDALPYNSDFLLDVYEEEITDNPTQKLEKAEEFKELIETKLGELETGKTDSDLSNSKTSELKKELELELNLIEGTINKLEAGEEALANSGETETEVSTLETEFSGSDYESEFTQSVLLDQSRLSAAVLPDYAENISNIKSDDTVDQKTKYEDTKLVNSELMDKIDLEIESRVQLIDETENEASKDAIQFEITRLSQLKTNKSRENEFLDSQIENIESEELALENAVQGTGTESGSETTENTESIEGTESGSETAENTEPIAGTESGSETTENTESIEGTESGSETGGNLESTAGTESGSESQGDGEETLIAEEQPTAPVSTEQLVNSTRENLSPQQIKAEVASIEPATKSELKTVAKVAEPESIDDLFYSNSYEDLVENDADLNKSIKNASQISGLKNDLERLKETSAENEKAQAKLDKKADKVAKKLAKQELKNTEALITASESALSDEEAAFRTKMAANSQYVQNNEVLVQELTKLAEKAEMLQEDADIHDELAEETKKNLVSESKQRNKALANRLAAVENYKQANWLLDNSEELSKISPQALTEILTSDEEIPSATEPTLEELVSNSEVKNAEDLMADWDVTEEEAKIIKRSPAYVEYETKTAELEQSIEELKTLEAEIETLTAEGITAENQANELQASLETASEEEKPALETEIKRLRSAATVAYESAEEKAVEQTELKASTQELLAEVETLSYSLTKEAALTSAELASAEEPDFSNASVEELYAQSLDFSNATNKTIFARTKNVYSDTKPIPVDVGMPEGLVYKVQVGAFRNAISQTLYNEFAPVTGEKLDNGITRYTAGIFTSESAAVSAKRDVRGIGFSDAFVVAYLNGERISLAEARNMNPEEDILADAGESALQSINSSETETNSSPIANTGGESALQSASEEAVVNQTSGLSEQQSEQDLSEENQISNSEDFNPTDTADDYYQNVEGAAEANQVEVLKGLFYTVQVGVYSKPVSAEKIYNISPLNSERLTNGTIRYTTGIFNNLDRASARKAEIQATGISDAFITAYYNGKKISISEAKQKFQEEGIEVLNVTNQAAGNQATGSTENQSYSIIIGSFTDEVPTEVAKALLFLEDSRNIQQKKEGNTVTFYIESVNSMSTVNIIKSEFESFGVTELEVVGSEDVKW